MPSLLRPLWPATVSELAALIGERASSGASGAVSLNHRGWPITRFGIHTVVERNVLRTLSRSPSMAAKRVSPHSIRHTTQPTFCAPGSISTQFGSGSAMSHWKQPTSMPRSTSRPRPKRRRSAMCPRPKGYPGAGETSPPRWTSFARYSRSRLVMWRWETVQPLQPPISAVSAT
jgi:hypothetical protein